jgi:hypothetical protein
VLSGQCLKQFKIWIRRVNMLSRVPEEIEELAADPWLKVVGMLQQNWAVILESKRGTIIVFFSDTKGIFDDVEYESLDTAEAALRINGFDKYSNDPEAPGFIALPEGEFEFRDHPSGRIYSTGRFWER